MAQLALQYSALNHCATWEAFTDIFKLTTIVPVSNNNKVTCLNDSDPWH